jgi:hypothetical protein
MATNSFHRIHLNAWALCAFITAFTNTAFALPRGGGAKTCTCLCNAEANGSGYGTIASYNANGMSCGAFNGRACNIEDPSTGLIRTGSLVACEIGSFNSTFVWSRDGGLTIFPGRLAAPK